MSDQPKPPESSDGPDVGRVDVHSLARIAARVFDTPLLIHEGKLHQILQVLGPRLGFDLQQRVEPPAAAAPAAHQLARVTAGVKWEWNSDGRYYNVGRAAVIPVLGTLVQRSGWLDSLSGLKSYDSIEQSLMAAMEDWSVEEIIFDYDTPGGEAAGAFDLADRMLTLRGRKPMTAVVNELAASAGYLLASTAESIVIPRTGYAGSVGVVTAHVDMSQQLEKRGIVVTFVYAGAKKIDGNPYEPLSERVRAEWQREIDEMYGLFVQAVASHRKLEAAAVRSTEAGMFMGRAALERGFADQVNTLANVVHNTSLRRGGASRLNSATKGGPTMSDSDKAAREKEIAEARAAGVAQGKAEAQSERDQAVKTAAADATKAERARLKAIVTSEESKGRGELAAHLAFETDQPAEAAIALLKAAPKAEAKGPLATAMQALGTPGIRSTEQSEQRREQPKIDAGAIFAKLNEPYERALGARLPAPQQ
jgi:capsid assembly protease